MSLVKMVSEKVLQLNKLQPPAQFLVYLKLVLPLLIPKLIFESSSSNITD